ncbi:MAG: Maf family nucleotide pyrophosphatase [Planctomycetaceae bacterium]
MLGRLITSFDSVSPDVDEQSFHNLEPTPERLAQRLAIEKTQAVFRRFPNSIVIGSDQLVDLNGHVLGKPGTVSSAVAQLLSMSGQTHRLLTAVAIASPGKPLISILNETRLTMRLLTADEALRYVERDQPLDCAGSYKIESLGISLFEKIETEDFTAIMGLPLIEVSRSLRALGVAIP